MQKINEIIIFKNLQQVLNCLSVKYVPYTKQIIMGHILLAGLTYLYCDLINLVLKPS